MVYTTLAIILYFFMRETPIYGFPETTNDYFANLRFVFAGDSGSILHVGFIPLAMAYLTLSWLVAGEILIIDSSSHSGRQMKQSTFNNLFLFNLFFFPSMTVYSIFDNPLSLQSIFVCIQMIVGALILR